MKIGIISASNIRYSPYIFYYTKILDSCSIDYELIFANQEQVEDEFKKESLCVNWNSKRPRSIEYGVYAKKVIKIIKNKKYDGLIVLTSIMATYLSIFLKNNYKNRYIVDIRDYTHENIKPYFILEKIGVNNSALNIISSPKFKTFLPSGNYRVCHNMNFDVIDYNKKWKKPDKTRIKIGYIGAVIYKSQCKSLINLVLEDERFELHIYGFEPGDDSVKQMVHDIDYNRITYHGPYVPEEKNRIIESVDILFNTYGNGCPLLDTALSNKLYDAMYFKKLLLTSKQTYMEEVGGKIAFSLDYAEAKNLDALFEWITNLEEEEVQEYQDMSIKKFVEENDETEQDVINTLNKWM